MDAAARTVCASAVPASVPPLRERVADWLRAADTDKELQRVGALVATELLTNAITASGGQERRIGLRLECGVAGFRILVDSPGTGPTIAQLTGHGAGPDALHGRGLSLVRGLGGDLECGPAPSHFICLGIGCHSPSDMPRHAEVRHVVTCRLPSVASLV